MSITQGMMRVLPKNAARGDVRSPIKMAVRASLASVTCFQLMMYERHNFERD